MLILTRKPTQYVEIETEFGEIIKVAVLGIDGSQVKLGFLANPSVTIHRSEIADRIRAEKAHRDENDASNFGNE